MPGGSLTITVGTYFQLPAVAQRVLCAVAAGNRGRVEVRSNAGASPAKLYIPEEIFPGSLVLRRDGTDLLAGYVAGTHISYHAGNAAAVSQDPATCPVSTSQPTVSALATNVGGNPAAVTLTYANVAAAGTVNIYWGDGTSTLGAAESGNANHTYPFPGTYTIRIEDASSPADFGLTTVIIP